ncbi:MAG: hypothetical protein WD645_03045 [Dehalococcoidia bacterium]
MTDEEGVRAQVCAECGKPEWIDFGTSHPLHDNYPLGGAPEGAHQYVAPAQDDGGPCETCGPGGGAVGYHEDTGEYEPCPDCTPASPSEPTARDVLGGRSLGEIPETLEDARVWIDALNGQRRGWQARALAAESRAAELEAEARPDISEGYGVNVQGEYMVTVGGVHAFTHGRDHSTSIMFYVQGLESRAAALEADRDRLWAALRGMLDSCSECGEVATFWKYHDGDSWYYCDEHRPPPSPSVHAADHETEITARAALSTCRRTQGGE